MASGVRSTIGAISSNGTREDVVEDEGEPFRRRERLEHDEQREADRVREQRLLLGVDLSSVLDDRVGQPASVDSSGRARRDRRMSRQTRPTTVVSQPPRFSIELSSVRASRSQASCTASSLSSILPSIR